MLFADLFALHGYHADGIRAQVHERDQCCQPAGGPEETAAGPADAAGLPSEAELVDCEIDDEVVQPAEQPPAGAQGEQVQERGDGHKRPEGGVVVTPPGSVGERNEKDNENVDDEKPDRHNRDAGDNLQLRGVGVEHDPGQANQRPGRQNGKDRQDEPLQPVGQPGGVAFLPVLGSLPAEPIDVAADEEKDRHDLEEPGQPLDPGDGGEEVGVNQLVVPCIDGDDQPVAQYDEADGGGAQEIDVAVAIGRGLRGEASGVGPDR